MTTNHLASSQGDPATTLRKTFSRETSVSTQIQADPAVLWAILTNASDYPRWNTTVLSVEGDIQLGETIKLKSVVDPFRTFKLKVKQLQPESSMVWADGVAPFFRGVRTYTLHPQADGSTQFTMREKLAGLMFPMAAKHIPDFDESFTQFAADLKQEAEAV